MDEVAIKISTMRFENAIWRSSSRYYMLLSHEGRDYTVFDNTSLRPRELTKEVFSLLKSRGKLKGVDIQDDYSDFWIDKDGNIEMYKFFPYDWGVIKV